MSVVRGNAYARLLIVLLIVAAAAVVASCGDNEATTTSGAQTTGSAGQTATTVGLGIDTTSATNSESNPATNTEITTATTTAQNPGTQPVTPGELPQTPPSVVAGESGPPQPAKEYAEQLPELEQTVKEDPKDLDALAELAIAYYQTQAFAKAEETYKKMIAIENRAQFHNNLANVYRDWGQVDLAVKEYETAIDLDPQTALWYGNLAAMYMMNGDIAKAKEVAQLGIKNTTGENRAQLERLLESFS